MTPELHEQLIEYVKSLRATITDIAIGDLVTLIMANQRGFYAIVKRGKTDLSSPYQQSVYLLGLALSQPLSGPQQDLTQEKYEKIISLLNKIFNCYAIKYFEENYSNKTKVVMGAFANYFFTGMNMSTTGIKSWIKEWYERYDSYLLSKYDFTVDDLLKLGERIEEEIEKNHKELEKTYQIYERYQKNPNVINILDSDDKMKLINFKNTINQLHMVKISKVKDSKKFDSIINFLGVRSGDANEITYITDINTLEYQPVILDNTYIYYPITNMYYVGIVNFLEREIYKNHPKKDKNLQQRDVFLEEQTTKFFKKILGDDAQYWEGLVDHYQEATFEHDLVISYGNTLLIVEAKASPPKEPMRDVERAFVKIRDHFRSNSGLQKAFDQGNNFKKRIISEGRINLYKGNKYITTLEASDYENIFCICITRDDYGSLGCLIDYLLDKEPQDNYPWVCDISNLKSIAMAWEHLELDYVEFFNFLKQRLQVYGKVIGTDELEYVGAYLEYRGGLDGFIKAKADFIPLSIDASDIFDKIWYEELNNNKYHLVRKNPDFYRLNQTVRLLSKVKKSKTKKKQVKLSKRANRK